MNPNKESFQDQLERCNKMIEKVDETMRCFAVIDDQELLIACLKCRVDLAGVKGKLEYLLTLC